MDDQGDRVDPADLRVSDAEREHVLRLLQEAMARGMLDSAEFDDRSGRVVHARVRRDLNVLVADLAVQNGSGAPARNPDSIELGGSYSSLRRQGTWVVPRRIVLRHHWGSVDMDFTQARIDHPVVEVEVDTVGSSIQLRLPDGATASLDGIEMHGGSSHDRRHTAARDGGPHFVVTGRVRWGSVSVRGPRRGPFGGR
jgi:hypothetical protein